MIITYDIEVYKYDFFFGAKYYDGPKKGERIRIYNDIPALKKFLEEHSHYLFVGYNNAHYDDRVVGGAIRGADPYMISSDIIERGKMHWYKFPTPTFDLIQDLFGQKPSLNLIKYNEGLSIEEIPITEWERKLTPEEVEMIWYYNDNDVDTTELVLTKAYDSLLGVKVDVLNYFGMGPENMNISLPTVIAKGMGAKKGKFPPRAPEWFSNLEVETPGIQEWFLSEGYRTKGLDVTIAGVPHKLGIGGIHGARLTCYYPRVLLIDVKGYYSLIMMTYDAFSRALDEIGIEKYTGMYQERLDRQAVGDPSANSLKIGILAVWGATRNKHQLLFDETTGYRISLTGQLFLVDLIEKLAPYVELVQSNTDGIMVYPLDEAKVLEEVDKWVKRTGFEVSIDEITELYQKDVNNYICYDGGRVLTKGNFATSYGVDNVFKYGAFFKYHASVVDHALVDYLLHDTPIEETVMNEEDPMRFMMASTKGPTYQGCEVHKTYPDGTVVVEPTNDINRVFASNDDSIQVEVKKFKMVQELQDEGSYCPLDKNGGPIMHVPPRARKPRPKVDGIWKERKAPARIPNLPNNVFIFNGDLSEFDMHHQIDKQWYIDETIKRLNMFLGD